MDSLKKETDDLILAAQDQALRTNSIKYSIDKNSETPRCRWGGESTETVRHIVSGCKKLEYSKREYRKHHDDKVVLRVHWEICRKYGRECTDNWYDHQPLPVAENGVVRIAWDVTIYTDKVLKHNRPDITLVHKVTEEWTLIDIAVPANQNIIRTEEEKVELALKSEGFTEPRKSVPLWQARCARLPRECTVVVDSWNYPR